MLGMDRTTGAQLAGDEHLAQSVSDILTTPLGTRVMRRDYGSLLFELVDKPLNGATRLLCVMAIALAISRWEPRLTVKQVLFDGEFASGSAVITIIGTLTGNPSPNALTRLTIPLR